MNKSSRMTADYFLKLPLFANLHQSEVCEIIAAAHEKRLHTGGYYYLQGDQADHVYVLVAGLVKRLLVGENGKQVLIQVITPVHLFGLSAITTGTIYPVTAEAAVESQAIFWSRHELMGYVRRIPQMALNAMQVMAEQLHEMQDRFCQVATQNVEQRLAHTLFRLASQAGKKVSEGILIDLALTRQELAEMSGTTLYTVSRTLRQWEGQNLVRASRQRVIIRNPHGLAIVIQGNTCNSIPLGP